MPTVIYCLDKPDSLDLRMANREAHLAHMRDFNDRVLVAGPMLSDDGSTMIGSMLVMNMDDRAEVDAMLAKDPYVTAGLFGQVDIRPFKALLPFKD